MIQLLHWRKLVTTLVLLKTWTYRRLWNSFTWAFARCEFQAMLVITTENVSFRIIYWLYEFSTISSAWLPSTIQVWLEHLGFVQVSSAGLCSLGWALPPSFCRCQMVLESNCCDSKRFFPHLVHILLVSWSFLIPLNVSILHVCLCLSLVLLSFVSETTSTESM